MVTVEAGDRKGEREAAARGPPLGADRPSLPFDEHLAEVEPEPEAPAPAGLDVPLEKPLEHLRLRSRREPDPRVGDVDRHPALSVCPAPDLDPAAGPAELDGVVDEV